jgi:hypothetical protein
MSEQRREQLRLLVRVLFSAAVAVIALSVIVAIQIGTSDSDIPIFGDIQQQNRGVIALGTFGGGVVGAGILAGLAGILLVLLERDQPNE